MRLIWWCENHNAEQVDGGYGLCFRGPSHFPTAEAEQHQCRFVEMQLLPFDAVVQIVIGEPYRRAD